MTRQYSTIRYQRSRISEKAITAWKSQSPKARVALVAFLGLITIAPIILIIGNRLEYLATNDHANLGNQDQIDVDLFAPTPPPTATIPENQASTTISSRPPQSTSISNPPSKAPLSLEQPSTDPVPTAPISPTLTTTLIPEPVPMEPISDQTSPAPTSKQLITPEPSLITKDPEPTFTPPSLKETKAPISLPRTDQPSPSPSPPPSTPPTPPPSYALISATPTPPPSTLITNDPTNLPKENAPKNSPSTSPINVEQEIPTPIIPEITFVPGNLTKIEHGLLLSEGLTARLIAESGIRVTYADGSLSNLLFHSRPDGAATFVDQRPNNPGGWVYVSNSEVLKEIRGEGGVGAITFNRNGDILHYDMLLTESTWNCGGGRTPWNTWISCEESPKGQIFQVDPFGRRESEILTTGREGGRFEAFAYDVRDLRRPHFYVTEDHHKGALRRFTPSQPRWDEPWDMLHQDGTTEFLVLEPNANMTGGTYSWTTNPTIGRDNAEKYYPNSEGIDINGSICYFVCKKIKQLFQLNLDDFTYSNQTTVRGLFDGQPDQMNRMVGGDDTSFMYFTEEGGKDAGVHGRNGAGQFFTIFESPFYIDETTGLAFSPDGRHLYVAYQANGLLFDVTRTDGFPFHAEKLDVKYHNAATGIE